MRKDLPPSTVQSLHQHAVEKRASGHYRARGATLNMAGRFETLTREWFDDGWADADEIAEAAPETAAAENDDTNPPRLKTVIHIERARSIISRNDSPDLRFTQSINPYRGCEHGCIYCFARPTHSYLNLSPGLDFETQLFSKRNAAERLRAELSRKGYRPSPINIGAATDPYQPIERSEGITRSVIEVLAECRHPLTLVTKNSLVMRDIDLLAPMAERRLAAVLVSLSQLDNRLSRILEPRASSPAKRLQAIRALNEVGIPVYVMVAPIIPFINDEFMERVLDSAREAGARGAGYTLLRLPYELKDLFKDWLGTHFPDRAERVMQRIRDSREGRENDPRFSHRMRGSGPYAELIQQRFKARCQRLGMITPRSMALDCTQFVPPRAELAPAQASLF